MLSEIKTIWDTAPKEVKSLVMSASGGVLAQLFSPSMKADTKKHFNSAYRSGLEGFIAYLVKNEQVSFSAEESNIALLSDLIDNPKARGFFLNLLDGASPETSSRDIEETMLDLELDPGVIEPELFIEAAKFFLLCFEEEAKTFSEPLLLSIKGQMNQVIKLLKRSQPDLQQKLKGMQAQYFRYLNDEHATLSFKGFTEKMFKPPRLKKVYTTLSFSKENLADKQLSETDGIEEAFLQSPDRKLKESNIASLKDILESKFSVITGEPGAGKSTLLKYICVDLIEKQRSGKKETGDNIIPIIFPISNFAEKRMKTETESYTLKTFIPDYFQDQCLDNPSNLFINAWENGRALFLIDGLDEVANETERITMVRQVRNFILSNNLRSNRFIITCRTASYTAASRFDPIDGREFDHYVVQPFGEKQIRAFLGSWYLWYERNVKCRRDNCEVFANQRLESMLSAIKSDKNILNIATNPLMLTILALIEHEGGRMPDSREGLYRKCLNMLAGTWEDLRGFQEKRTAGFHLGDRKITEDMIIGFLGPVAFEMHAEAQKTIDYKRLKKSLAEKFYYRTKDKIEAGDQAAAFIQIMKQRSGIIQETTNQAYGFMHQTFKEYLAARLLAEVSDDPINELGDKLFKAEWLEVVLLTAAAMTSKETKAFVAGILAQVDNLPKNIILATECILDMGRDRIPDALFDEIVESLEKEMFSNHTPVEKTTMGELLGIMGDGRVLDRFIPIPDGTYDLEGWKKTVDIEPFEISKFPVTNHWFACFVNANGYLEEHYWSHEGKKWRRHKKHTQPGHFDHKQLNCPNSPVVGVSWYEANAFCRWLTMQSESQYVYRLPSEKQWQAAAAGFNKREYPWGEWEPGRCNTRETEIKRISPVGIFPHGDTLGPDGVSDLAGNVWEWTCSDYESQKNLKDFEFQEDYKKIKQMPVLRGGSWNDNASSARCANRNRDIPVARFSDIGFRCVRTLK